MNPPGNTQWAWWMLAIILATAIIIIAATIIWNTPTT